MRVVVADAVEQQLLLLLGQRLERARRRRCRTPRRPTRAGGGSTWRGPRPTARSRRRRPRARGRARPARGRPRTCVPRPSQARAGAVGRVEREVAGRELLEALAVRGARQLLGEGEQLDLGIRRRVLAGHQLDLGDALGELQRGLHRVGEAALDAVAQHQAVDDDLDGVLLVAGQVERDGQVVDLAVDAGTAEALAGQVDEELLVGALAAAHDRGQHLEAGALGQLQDAVDDLLRRLAHQRLAGVGVVRDADAGEQQAEVVVDLGDGADGRAGVAGRGLLVDRDGRRQALDEVDVGLVHLPEELAGVGRQRLDVAALALGVDRVERQRGLARSRTGPVKTMSLSRGRSSETSRRLCSRAPRMTILSAGWCGVERDALAPFAPGALLAGARF